MDVPSIQAVAQSSSPQPQPDLRPTADAAAVARDPSPEIPLPPSLSQQGVVSAGMLRGPSQTSEIKAVEEVGRTLKPYGISMLPSEEARETARDAAKAEADAAQAEREAKKADDAAADAARLAEAAAMPAAEQEASIATVEGSPVTAIEGQTSAPGPAMRAEA